MTRTSIAALFVNGTVMRKGSSITALTLLALAPLAGCSAIQDGPGSLRQTVTAFHVVGYLPDYRTLSIDDSLGLYVTDLIYFSIEPKPSGELDSERLKPEALTRLREIKRRHGARLFVAVGGSGRSKGFGPMATDKKARDRLVRALTRFCLKNQLDGADFDWEFPENEAEKDAYAALLVEVKRAFKPHGLLVTVALAVSQKLSADAYQAVDRVHLMVYDRRPRHSTFEQATAAVHKFLSYGIPRKKIYLGVPFYGRPVRGGRKAMTYARIVRKYHPGPNLDEVGGIYFNGINTIQRKTRYAMEQGLGGIMIWELGQDAKDDSSLLRAVHRVVSE